MVKSILKMMMIAFSAAAVLVACGGDGAGDNPGDNPNGGNDQPAVEDFAPAPTNSVDVPTKLPEAFVNGVKATDEGVSIEVTSLTTDNFIFTVRPGDFVQSYRLDVFPLCRLYNSLYEQMRSEGKSEASTRDVDTWIRSFIFNSTGAGAYTFSPDSHTDYLEKEFDWMNSVYSQAKIVPNAEYIIVAVACYDKDGVEDGEMSLCYVKTPSKPLVGNPDVEIVAKTNFRAMEVSHYPNADCKYLYYYCSNEDDLMPYINTYGRQLYIDFMRHTIGTAIAANDTENLSYYRDFGQSADSRVPIMATAIALDGNQTPAADFNSVVFSLQEMPEGVAPGNGEISVQEAKLGANYFWYDYTIDNNTYAMFWKIYTAEEAEYYQTQATEAELEALAEDIDYDGWGLKNENYSYNETTDTYGDSYSASEVWYAKPDTEYVIGYTARNRLRKLSPVKFTKPFRTKAVVTDTPEACESNCELTVTSMGRTSVKVTFNYDFSKHAGVRFQYIEPVLEGSGQPSSEADRETFLKYFSYVLSGSTTGDYFNDWCAEPHGQDSFTFAGLNPGTKYKFAYMCEDWKGVVGPVKFAEATTAALEGGDNPEAVIEYTVSNGVGTFTFVANEQTEYMKYMVGTLDTDGCDALGLADLGQVLSGEEYFQMWKTFCSSNGLTTYNLKATLNNTAAPAVALCIPYGKNEVRGQMVYAIFDGKSIKSLTDYYPSYNPSSISLKGVLPTVAAPTPRRAVPAAQLREAREEGETPVIRVMRVDMQRLAAHPHATM